MWRICGLPASFVEFLGNRKEWMFLITLTLFPPEKWTKNGIYQVSNTGHDWDSAYSSTIPSRSQCLNNNLTTTLYFVIKYSNSPPYRLTIRQKFTTFELFLFIISVLDVQISQCHMQLDHRNHTHSSHIHIGSQFFGVDSQHIVLNFECSLRPQV